MLHVPFSMILCTMADGPYGFLSYKTPQTVVSEAVYQFLHGCLYGAAWGLVTPFPPIGQHVANTGSGAFRPLPVLGHLRGVPSHALFFGTVLGVQRLGAKSMELIRMQEDWRNDAFGFAVLYPYYTIILNHANPRRLVYHNRFVGSVIVGAVLYANVLA